MFYLLYEIEFCYECYSTAYKEIWFLLLVPMMFLLKNEL